MLYNDLLLQNYYTEYFDNLTEKELDDEFTDDLRVLTKSLNKLPDSKRKAFINILSRYIEFYIDKKIEKQINSALKRILDFYI